MIIDKDRLAAFADGQLSPEEAAAVVMHLADHPEDQAWVDDLMAANAVLSRAYSAPMQEPVPDRFLDLILPGAATPAPSSRVISFRRSRLITVLTGVGIAAAAALATVVVLTPPPETHLAAGRVAAGSQLEQILDRQPTGKTMVFGEGEMTILASFPATSGFCREIEQRQPDSLNLALACSSGKQWVVDVVMAETLDVAPEAPGFVPASGDVETTLDPWLTARGAGQAMSLEQEQGAIAKGWESERHSSP